jgi:hypothetical protein
MEPTKEQIKALDREEVERSRQMTFAQKFLAGAELFDYACDISRASIRMIHPHLSEEQVTAELRRRMRINEALEARQ